MRKLEKNYRDYLYRWKQHPCEDIASTFRGENVSFFPVYVSFLFFFLAEYVMERRVTVMPSGIVFPVGFFLFWSFYYALYRPERYHSQLANGRADLLSVKSIGIIFWGALLWISRVLTIELFYGLKKLFDKNKLNTNRGSFNYHPNKAPLRPNPRSGPPLNVGLPSDMIQALRLLGLPPTRSWRVIHARYRELAKKYHPDAHPDFTGSGGVRFMIFDAAYKKLYAVRSKFFHET